MGVVYKRALKFKQKYPGTVAWRLQKNSSIIEKHLKLLNYPNNLT